MRKNFMYALWGTLVMEIAALFPIYISLCISQTQHYGPDVNIEKTECVQHVQKRNQDKTV